VTAPPQFFHVGKIFWRKDFFPKIQIFRQRLKRWKSGTDGRISFCHSSPMLFQVDVCGLLQEMVTVETFTEFIRKKDVGRIRFAIRETLYDLDATDEVTGLSKLYTVSQKTCHFYFRIAGRYRV